ncbi:hypothetical protein NL676_027538 [Syzygium grande]|nr:hypothetical protein NL676_027538 [Syzygium grande]
MGGGVGEGLAGVARAIIEQPVARRRRHKFSLSPKGKVELILSLHNLPSKHSSWSKAALLFIIIGSPPLERSRSLVNLVLARSIAILREVEIPEAKSSGLAVNTKEASSSIRLAWTMELTELSSPTRHVVVELSWKVAMRSQIDAEQK